MVTDDAGISSVILAGGMSARLGTNKALQVINGRSLIQWVADCLASVSTEIIIATADDKSITCTSPVPITAVADVLPGKGPLAGIHVGLMASSSPCAIVVGCDMPFLSGPLLQHMHRLCAGHDAVVAAIDNKIEPLCAVYSKSCLASIEVLLEKSSFGVRELFDLVRVRYVGEDEFNAIDPGHLSLFNINSQSDLDMARVLADRHAWPVRRPAGIGPLHLA
ncbi:MAG: molybdenum cofactor guanylyltransferase [Armatimonadetes bacterium]|nr:molybdenum cofactor guanylyltransferase [Armatimonadota bacterium]